ncbi:glucosyltransferase [Pterulicium gracile]|uniref:Alpha-1,3-glucosyltransferase n=1 Tax=Pterulicium gracile TaxID=1884261 RepID=A0A5C3QWM1_9AGAR|nr:glucosyltransferase [Pterula gracilis]
MSSGLSHPPPTRLSPILDSDKTAQPSKPASSFWYLQPSEWDVLLLSTSLKLLLFPAYRSTDFEVHRNWLAITYSLPISQWYYEATSEWTLDYPPFFAYFEKFLSYFAPLVDARIVDLQNLKYDSWTVVAFQRSTVIITELVLGAALLRFIRGAVDPPTQRIMSLSLFLHPGLLIVDHIHFQYNGFLFGILLWSILMAREGNKLASGILFAVLLNFKHIFMYLAPAYFVYLLRSYCFSPLGHFQIKSFLSLANSIIAVFVLSFGPFIVMGQIPQVLSRLFPFTRGLNHAYWAPNFWALYSALDRSLLLYTKTTGIGLAVKEAGVASSSRGLIGDTVFAVLPNVQPIHTFLLTVSVQMVFLLKLWLTPTYKSFLTTLILCGYASFLFGWHVHEKAVLLVLVPLSLLAAERQAYFRTFMLASIAGIYSLFPLIFTPAESIVKVVYSTIWLVFVYRALAHRVYEYPRSLAYVVIDTLEKIYVAGFIPLHIVVTALSFMHSGPTVTPVACVPSHDFTCPEPEPSAQTSPGANWQFLPLLLTSVYCALGCVWAFFRLSFVYLKGDMYQGHLNTLQ